MKLLSVSRSPKHVEYAVEAQGHQAVEVRDFTCQEAPLAEFDDALLKLAGVVTSICEFRDVEGIEVHKLALSYTKHGTRSAQLYFSRTLSITGLPHHMKTPFVRIDHPTDAEEGRIEVTEEEGDKIKLLISEAIRYANGERQQLLLPLEDETEPSNGTPQQTDLPDEE